MSDQSKLVIIGVVLMGLTLVVRKTLKHYATKDIPFVEPIILPMPPKVETKVDP